MITSNTNKDTSIHAFLFKKAFIGIFLLSLMSMLFLSMSCHNEKKAAAGSSSENVLNLADFEETSLFDGKSMGQWKITDFAGKGDVIIEDGVLHLKRGNDMTGVTWSGPVIRMDYEISLQAMRVEGSDFFCALTFPVDSNSCSLVLGGWGGTTCGISNLDYYDAANNDTTSVYSFENSVWYNVKVEVRPNRLKAWVDGEQIVNVGITGRRIDTRFEVDMCKPLGIATWQTYGAIRNIKVKKLPPLTEAELKADEDSYF